MAEVVEEPPASLPYNFVMGLVKGCINDHGLRGAIVEPQMFSPSEYRLRKTVLAKGGNEAYHAGIHSQRTVAVNCFFQSTDEEDGPAMRALPNLHPESLWCKILEASNQNGLPSTDTVGGIPSADTVGGEVLQNVLHSMGTQALEAGSGTVEEFLQGDDLLHLASACKGTVTQSLRTTIDFILLLKRKLWSRHFQSLALESGLAEHEMLSIVATSHRILLMQGFRQPIVPWDSFPLRLWLDVLLDAAVASNCAVTSREKAKAFLKAIKKQYPRDHESRKDWYRAKCVFVNRFF